MRATNLKTMTPEETLKAADELLEFLEKMIANLHVPVHEGTYSGSLSLDEGTSKDRVPEETPVFRHCGTDRSAASELQANERQVLQRCNDAGCTDEGVHEGQSEEEGAVDLIMLLLEQQKNIEKLMKMNTKLGGLAVKRYYEVKNND